MRVYHDVLTTLLQPKQVRTKQDICMQHLDCRVQKPCLQPPSDACALAASLQVWDYSASADARDTEGGASKRSLLEQIAKMRAYLTAQGVDLS
jgi:hypothetical protein